MYDQRITERTRMKRDLQAFVQALFQPEQLVELRLVETWRENNRQCTNLIDRLWLPAAEIADRHQQLLTQNRQGANVFFGVNPRTEAQGTKSAIANCHTLWCDWDGIDAKEALLRCKRIDLSPPSVLVASGHGVHGYWLLETPVAVHEPQTREVFEGRLQQLSRTLGGDATQDVSRLMRLPGFMNMKGYRTGTEPVPCDLLFSHPTERHRLTVHERWGMQKVSSLPLPPSMSQGNLSSTRTAARIRGLVQYLDREVIDRSRRDYGVVVGLLRLGVKANEIRRLVDGKSKFAEGEGGDRYLDRTLERAAAALASRTA